MLGCAFVMSLSGRYLLAGFAGEWELPAGRRLAPEPLPGKARGAFILRVIFLFPGFHISLAGSSSPTTPDVRHRTVARGRSGNRGDGARCCLSEPPGAVGWAGGHGVATGLFSKSVGASSGMRRTTVMQERGRGWAEGASVPLRLEETITKPLCAEFTSRGGVGWAELSGSPLSPASHVAFSSKPPEKRHWCLQPGSDPAPEDCGFEPPGRSGKEKHKISPSAPAPRLRFPRPGQRGQLCWGREMSSDRLRLLRLGKAEAAPGGTMARGSPGPPQPFSGALEAAGDGAGASSAHAHPRPCCVRHQTPPLEEAPSCRVRDGLNQPALAS